MKLSIVIVNYNTRDYLKKCLDCLIVDESFPSDWEVIVVDNGSSQKLSVFNIQYPITVIKNNKNLGFSKANNIGIRNSKGEYVLLLNPDTIASQKAIGYVVDYMKSHDDVAIATCKVELPDGKIDDASHRGFPTPWRAFCHFSGISKLFPNSLLFNGYHLGYKNMDMTHEIDACVGAFMMIKRDIGEKLNWLDEDYFWYGEDLDICYRAKKKGYKVIYIPDVSITHYKGVSSGIKKESRSVTTASPAVKKKAQIARFEAMRIFYKKHYRKKYPKIIQWVVIRGIGFIEQAIGI